LFANIFKTIRRENKIDTKVIDNVYKMIDEAVNIELEFAKQLIKDYPVMGMTDQMLDMTVKNYANERMTAIGLDNIYKKNDKTFLQKLVDRNVNFSNVERGSFDTTNTNYEMGNNLEFDF